MSQDMLDREWDERIQHKRDRIAAGLSEGDWLYKRRKEMNKNNRDLDAIERKQEAQMDKEIQALSYGFGYACTLLSAGKDPRKFPMPEMLDDWMSSREGE